MTNLKGERNTQTDTTTTTTTTNTHTKPIEEICPNKKIQVISKFHNNQRLF